VASLSMQAFWEVQTRRIKAGGRPCGPPWLLPILYAVSSALIGTQSVVQAKAFSELMELWLGSGVNIWVEWYTYVVLAYFLVTVAFWLYRLNAALGKYDPLFIIPLLQASYIVLATVAGGLYFQEFAAMKWWQGCVFACCIGIMFVGLAMLMPPITGASAPEPLPGPKNESSTDDLPAARVSFVRLTGSVSFANTPSFRATMATRESERRPSQVAAMYGGAGAGLSFRSSFAGSLPARSRATSCSSSPVPNAPKTENSLITIQMDQMPSLGEVSEYSERSCSQKDFRRIASGRVSAPPPPGTPLPPVTPPPPQTSIGDTPTV